jgi:hypothetical protein
MRGTAASFSSVILMVAGICAYESTAPEAPKAATASAEESTEALLAKLGKATARDERDGIVTILLGRDKPALEKLRKYADQRVSGLEKQYTDFLNANLRTLYKQKLLALTDEQITSIQKTRRFWKPYLLAAMHDDNFMHDYLEPAKEVSKLLLLDAEKDLDERGKGLRAELLEAGGYQTKCNLALGGDPDPTKGKKSPTGIAIPPLSSPPTFQSYVSYLEKTLVLANTVAPEGARKVLLKNLEISREIDIEEADYVLYANEIRMCMGSQAWSVDPLLCAATRDHSTDRKNGKASAHMSTIPGKEGFVDRAKRFGTGASSEGAGGGRNGRNYLEGLSHEGDGHTGPLYGIHRNVIGVGRHEGVYTSNYRTDHTLDHPCPVTTGEQFMPPGLTGKEFANPTAASVFTCLKNSQYGVAQTIIAKALETPTDKNSGTDYALKQPARFI